MEPPTEQRDPRMDFLSNYTCKALRLKEDKWSRMIVSDEQRSYLNNFMEGCWPQARFFSNTESFIETCNVKKILKGSLDSISSPSPSVKIQIICGKVCLRCRGKTLLGIVHKTFEYKIKVC